jgi:hypothetical protein
VRLRRQRHCPRATYERLPARQRVLDRDGARRLVANIEESGPGSFSGPFVDSPQALAVLAAFIAAFAAITAVLLRRRDIA